MSAVAAQINQRYANAPLAEEGSEDSSTDAPGLGGLPTGLPALPGGLGEMVTGLPFPG